MSTPPTVLVVEDERELAKLFAEWLRDDYRVEIATDGEDALERVESADVVLLDRLMPGISGDEVLEEIRERDLSVRVAMVTAVEPDFDVLEMGFDDYVVKPLFRDDLTRLVAGLLARDEYGRRLSDLFAAVSKLAALEAHKTDDELAANEEYRALKRDVVEMREELQRLEAEMDRTDFDAVFYDFSEVDLQS
ncbi:MAG: response regulator [Haloplanus sp.]